MILKALYDYYHRCDNMPPFGLTEKEIPFLIVIDEKGNFIRVEDRRIDKKLSQKFLVVPDSRSSGIKPYLFYDNLEYALGWNKKGSDGNDDKCIKKHNAFTDKCKEIANKYPESDSFKAVSLFYENGGVNHVMSDPLWEAMTKVNGANISFILNGKTEIVASSPELQNETGESNGTDNRCLITGEQCKAVETTTATMIPGSQATAKLVAFQIKSGYDSYGKSQGSNAPISQYAEFAYTTALLRLLDKKSRNKFFIGNRTFLFWASSMSESAKLTEESIFSMFGFSDEDKEDPNTKIESVRKTFRSIYTGEVPCKSNDRFYILGLAPNSARIAVVYWSEISLKDFSEIILRHFEDMDIYNTRNRLPNFGLKQIMSAVAFGGKASNVQPNLPEATLKSIFQGLPYPQSLYSASLRRIRAELSESMRITRIAILKAYLNRINNNNNNKILLPMLDKTNLNTGYLCGRLFAIIEYAQYKANNINSIKERYMSSASATPAVVFSTLLNLSVHHVEKLDKNSDKIYIEKLKQEVIDLLPSEGFPAHLDLNDQGRFFIGYYQQYQDFFTKKEDKSEQ